MASPLVVYYPGCACNLIIRFDEALLTGTTPPAKSSAQLAVTAESASEGPPSETAGILQGSNSRLSRRYATVPTKATIELPSFRQAPKFSLTFAFRDFPVDPRAVRALGVELFLGTIPSSDWQRGLTRQSDYGRLASIIANDRKNLVLAGLADVVRDTFGETGSEVQIEGRGLQGIFLDLPISAEAVASVNVDQKISDVIADLLKAVKLADKIPMETTAPTGGEIPVVGAKAVVTRINLNAKGSKTKRATKGENSSLNFWDIVTNFCFLVGYVPDFNGHTLRLRPAVSLYDKRKIGLKGQSPFKDKQPRTIQTNNGSEQLSVRRMVYGRNLLNFMMERKLGGTAKTPIIRCVSTVTDSDKRGSGRLLEVFWPPNDPTTDVDGGKLEDAQTTDVAPNGEGSQKNILTVAVSGVKDEERLREVAHAIYEEVCRGELTGSASTKDLASFGGNNEDADLLRLRPGEPVQFQIDSTGVRGQPPIVNEVTNLASMSPEEATDQVAERLGGDRDLAQVIVGTVRGTLKNLQDTFRVGTVRYGWDVDQGIAVDFDFQNYVEVRFDVMKSEAGVPTDSDTTDTRATTPQGSVKVPRL